MNPTELKYQHRKMPNSEKGVWLICILAIGFISVRNLSLPWGDLFSDGGFYGHYNNYIIFKQSFFHLIKHQDLYIHFPQEQYDLFKYPPTFALLFAPFSILPDSMGYTLWTAINLLLPVLAIFRLKGVSNNLQGNIQVMIEAASGEFFSIKDLAKGKKDYDKRETIKKREADRYVREEC
jgi:hypothetical protein